MMYHSPALTARMDGTETVPLLQRKSTPSWRDDLRVVRRSDRPARASTNLAATVAQASSLPSDRCKLEACGTPGARALASFPAALLALVTLFFAATAHAQSVRWEADPGNPSALQLVFDDCTPDGQPDPPAIPGTSFSYVGESQNMSIVNFQVTRTVALNYLVRSSQRGPLQIPAFTVKTNRGNLRVAAFNGATPAAPVEAVASSKLTPERNSVWAGEVFGLTYELSASRRNNPQVNQTFDWNPAPLIAEDWSKPEVNETTVGGDRRLLVTYRTRAIAKTPNMLKLDAAVHLMNVQTGTVGFGFLSQPRMEPVSVTSDQPTIEVRQLPPSPAGFSGAVGQFKLASKVVPERAAVGEPVTWTLELAGTGNWPDIAGLPSRDVSSDFQVVQPKAKRTPAEGRLFDVSLAEDVGLVPTKPGMYTLGPVSFSYFDPKSGTYKTVTTPRTTLNISAPNVPQFNVTPAPDNANEGDPGRTAGADTTRTAPPEVPDAAALPAGIPRDPLPGTAEVAVPMTGRDFTLLLLAPLAGVLVFWLALAIRRARETDPARPRWEARARLLRTLSQLQHAEPAERAPLLLAWQRDTATLWQIPHAAPSSRALQDAGWSRLWIESDRALYAQSRELPADWVARAQEALAAARLPGFKPWRLFLPRNLMPFAAAVAVTLLVASSDTVHAQAPSVPAGGGARLDPAAAYRRGDFAAAETAWRARLQQAPTDWIAHHNLALALVQQERAGEAVAHAAAAFVQQPSHPSTRWHLALAADRADAVPAELAPFLRDEPLAALWRQASPAVWQRLALASACVTALALGWLLWNSYRARRRWQNWTALGLAGAALLVVAAGIAGWQGYGVAADARASVVARSGVLRSIPTEAETNQKTTTLATGAIGVSGNTFLGWTQLAFDNEQTGWVRNEEIVPLWR